MNETRDDQTPATRHKRKPSISHALWRQPQQLEPCHHGIRLFDIYLGVNVIAPSTLRAFWEQHPAAEAPLKAWQKLIQAGTYSTWADLRNDFPRADYISERRLTIFDIGGNKYRLITFIRYESQTVFIKHIYTHAEYDKWSKGGRP